MDSVDRTLQEWRRTLFEWGKTDCVLSVAKHAASVGQRDIRGLHEGLYQDAVGATNRLVQMGGMCSVLQAIGLNETIFIKRGDIVVVDFGANGDPIAAICTGDAVAARLERGMTEISLRFVKIIKAWSCPL